MSNGDALIISPRGIIHRFWSHLRCLRRNVNIFIKVYFRVAHNKITENSVILFICPSPLEKKFSMSLQISF